MSDRLEFSLNVTVSNSCRIFHSLENLLRYMENYISKYKLSNSVYQKYQINFESLLNVFTKRMYLLKHLPVNKFVNLRETVTMHPVSSTVENNTTSVEAIDMFEKQE